MLKSFLAAVALSVPLALAAAVPAKADVDVDIFFGLPHYDYNVGPGYVFRPGYGWYNPNRGRLSCRQGQRLLERRGFDVVARLDCSGRTYLYRAENRRGRLVTIALNARTGEFVRVRR